MTRRQSLWRDKKRERTRFRTKLCGCVVLPAAGVAERVAAERGEAVGGTVGYQIRLERRASEHTKLLFVTTGILLRRLQADPQLEGVTHVILDEVPSVARTYRTPWTVFF